MDTDKKIKVTVLIKAVDSKQTKEIEHTDEYRVLHQVKRLFKEVSGEADEVGKEEILHLLNASKLSNEIMADAFINVNREDLFDDKIKSILTIDEIINQINNI
jgi:hypothetical protein